MFDYWLTLLISNWFVQIFYFISWYTLCSLYAIGHYLLVPGCLTCWRIVVHSILLRSAYLCITCNSYFWFYSFMPFYFLDVSGLKVCQFYFIYLCREPALNLIDLFYWFLITILFIFALVFIIFLLLILVFVLHCPFPLHVKLE